MNIAQYIDHTNVKPTATAADIKKLCQEARKYKFYSVCVTPVYVKLAKKFLSGSGVKTITVIGFPHGSETTLAKAMATYEAVKNGADEVDMVMNIGALKAKNYRFVQEDIKAVVKAVCLSSRQKEKRPVKVIIETGYLTKAEIKKASQLVKKAGAAFVKTCTGFAPGKATVADIKLIRKTVGPKMGIKASGGIRDYQTALAMIKAGATRIGTSAGVAIIKGKKSKVSY